MVSPGQDRLKAMEEAGRTPHAFVPHHSDNQCAACGHEVERHRLRNVILHGDVREKLRELDAESVHCVVTSPPYWGLRDYGTALWSGGDEDCDHVAGFARHDADRNRRNPNGPIATREERKLAPVGGEVQFARTCGKCGAVRIDSQLGLEPTPEEYVENMVAVFREVRRVLRKDGTVWLNLGDSYAAGGRGGEFSERSAKQASNGGSYSGAIRRDHNAPLGLKPKDLVGIPWRVAFALQADGWWLRSDIVWSKPNPMPESVTDRPTKAHEYLFLLSKSQTYYYDAEAIKEKDVAGHPSGNGYARVDTFNVGIRLSYGGRGSPEQWQPGAGRNRRTVWEIPTEPYAEAHFATFPTELVKPCILAGTSEYGVCSVCGAPWERVTNAPPAIAARDFYAGQEHRKNGADRPGGFYPEAPRTTGWEPTCKHEAPVQPAIVLDPFGGSGTTALVALRAARDYILVELNPAYVEMAERRLAALKNQGRLL